MDRFFNQRHVWRWVVLGGFLLHPCSWEPTRAQTAPPRENLEFGKPQERALKGGEKHRYTLPLKANDYLKLVVAQRGIDVVVRLIGPDEAVVREVDNPREPTGNQGEEPLVFIAEQAGTYRLEIESGKKTAQPGTYRLASEAVRTATEPDRIMVEVNTLLDRVDQLWRAGKHEQGIQMVQQAVEKSEKILGPEHPLLATSLTYQALLYTAKGDNQRAEALHQRALAMREKTLEPEHPEVAQSLAHLGVLYRSKGDSAKAEAYLQRALAIREKALGPDHPEVAQSLNQLGAFYRATGDYPKAAPFLLRALAIYENALGPEHAFVATTLNNLGLLSWNKGDYLKAEGYYQRSLQIREQTLGPNHLSVATTLNNLGDLYLATGDYTKAERFFLRDLTISEKALGPEHPNVAETLNNLGALYWSKGDTAKAEPYYQRSLQIREKTLGSEHREVATPLNNLGLLYQVKGEVAKAEACHQRALAIKEKALGPEHPSVATTLNNLGDLYRDKGDDSKAAGYYQRALAIRQKALGPNHPYVALSLNQLGALSLAKGEVAKAEGYFQQALAIREQTLGPEHPDVARSLHHLSVLALAKGDPAQALAFQKRSNETAEWDLARNLVAGSERQKLLYLNQTAGYTDLTLSLSSQIAPPSREALETALTVILRRKGRGLDAMTTAVERLRQHQTPETQHLLDEYASLAGQISVLTLRGPEKKKPAEHFAYLKELEANKEKLEADISARSAAFKAQVTPITLENVRKKIPADGVLVEFASYQPFDAKTRTSGSPRLVVYLLNQGGEIKWADLGEAAVIDQAVSVLRKVLGNPKARLAEDLTPAAQALYRLVLKPVQALVGKANHLLISPDGTLNLIPFAALQDEQGRFVVEQCNLTYLTSGRDLLRLAVKLERHSQPLVLADPDYREGTGPTLLGRNFKSLNRLAGTNQEGRQFKTIFPTTQLKLQTEATEAVLKQAAGPELLHIATHGYFLEDAQTDFPTSDSTRMLMRDEDTNLAVRTLRTNHPLLRSWLFFAGANQGGADDNDGVMTGLEAAQLDLWGTKLVTLSACDTGLGEVKNGDGVYGLRRALVLAGSEAQMMSLWPVSDQATRELMADYYTRLKAGEGRSEALRNAQLRMLQNPKRKHPYFWASFIQSGEWANLNGDRRNSKN